MSAVVRFRDRAKKKRILALDGRQRLDGMGPANSFDARL